MILRTLTAMFGFGRVTLSDDSGELQKLQVKQSGNGSGAAQRILDQVPRIGHFGFASVPPMQSEALMLHCHGERSQSIVIATNHRPSRPRDMKPGDVAIYDVRGRIIKLTADGIEVDGAGGVVKVTNASKVRCECDFETTGDLICRADGNRVSLSALRDAYDLHDHPPVAVGGQWGSGPPDRQV